MSDETPIRILIVDDDPDHAETLADALEMGGYRCLAVHSGQAGIEALAKEHWDVVLTDLVMADRSGLEVLKEAQVLAPQAAVLMLTGHASWETARDAMQQGAETYLAKPINLVELRTILDKVIEKIRLRRDNLELQRRNIDLQRQIDKRFGFEGILGNSAPMQRVFEILAQVSPSNATVLILGESGTGKELVARALHHNSPRSAGNFVAVNCAALSEGLIESELFGHVRGAFTGAVGEKKGQVAYADGGTLFLDEVGDMPMATQAKLLRVLEEREVTKVGGNEPEKVDIRLVAATNRDLPAMVESGEFRQDLLFRLQVVTLELPPLRDRPGDLPLLLDHFVSELAEQHGRTITGMTPEARAILSRYPWPGNVRELRNAVENMVLLSRDGLIGMEDLPMGVRGGENQVPSGTLVLAGRSLADVERELIRVNLDLMDGNRAQTAEVLGIGERTLYRKLKEYGL